MEEVKQVIVIRKDLKMRRGKEIAQGAHASTAWMRDRAERACEGRQFSLSALEIDWLFRSSKKVTLQVDSERELMELAHRAQRAGLECHVITDSGATEFSGVPTKTCLAIGPDFSDKIDEITGDLKLY